MRICELAGCEAKHYGRGWCYNHYMQWFRTGQVQLTPTFDQRFWARADTSGACWLWTGPLFSTGYGQIKVNGKTSLAHRIAWQFITGAMPDGPLHHTCGIKRCVNPDHLHLHDRKTHAAEHKRLGNASGHGRETHCPAGHAYDEMNTYRDRKGSRHCKRCIRDRQRDRYQRRRQAAPAS